MRILSRTRDQVCEIVIVYELNEKMKILHLDGVVVRVGLTSHASFWISILQSAATYASASGGAEAFGGFANT